MTYYRTYIRPIGEPLVAGIKKFNNPDGLKDVGEVLDFERLSYIGFESNVIADLDFDQIYSEYIQYGTESELGLLQKVVETFEDIQNTRVLNGLKRILFCYIDVLSEGEYEKFKVLASA